MEMTSVSSRVVSMGRISVSNRVSMCWISVSNRKLVGVGSL